MKKTLLAIKLFLLSAVLAIAGCASAPQERVVIKTEIKTVTIPESMLSVCDVSAPPAKQDYLKLTYPEKEKVLVDYSLRLLTDLRLCNVKIKTALEAQAELVKNAEQSKAQ
jgi:hypothetical protein